MAPNFLTGHSLAVEYHRWAWALGIRQADQASIKRALD